MFRRDATCRNVNCRAAYVDKTSTSKTDSASHISDDWPILSCVVWGYITWWKLNNFSEKDTVFFSSGLRRWRHQEPPKEVTSHSIRTDNTFVLYFISAICQSSHMVQCPLSDSQTYSSQIHVLWFLLWRITVQSSWRYCYIANAVHSSSSERREHHNYVSANEYRCADKSLARPGSKQVTATEDFEIHISYL